jgi:sugar/nucleoside kinase (ribokinase family)
MAKILGLGNALVDIMIQLPDDSQLQKANLPKGSMQHVERSVVDQLLEQTRHLPHEITSGGSAANTIHGLARLGEETSFIGKTGPDPLGVIFRDDMLKSGIRPLLIPSLTDTGTAVAFVTPDSERTFAVFLGAALELSADDLNEEQFAGYDVLHIEGYLVQNHSLVEKALQLARAARLKVSLDLASFNVVESNHEFLSKMIYEYVDIVFANEDEALAFTRQSPEKAVTQLASICEIAVVKTGAKGSLICTGEKTFDIGIIPTSVRDTTGAGDLYAAGFLHAYLKGLPFEKCGQAGAILSGNVIRHLGAKIPTELWDAIVEEVNSL